jgi:AraC-like DNA-binding protein
MAGGERTVVIEELVEADGPLGIDYRKVGEGVQAAGTSERFTLYFPRCSSAFEVLAPKEGRGRSLDAYVLAIIPPRVAFQVRGVTSVADAVHFFPSGELVEEVGSTYGIDVRRRLAELGGVTILPRTNWLNEVMHRYVYERVVARERTNLACRFLEQEIVKEVYYRLEDYARLDTSRFDLDKGAMDLRGPTLRAAMDFIEANLFRDLAVGDIAASTGISESTLLREFRTRLKKSPQAYVVDRRLEEAAALLKGQRYSVSQVSDIVGYENVSSFSAAFKKKFAISPSQVVTKDLTARVEIGKKGG